MHRLYAAVASAALLTAMFTSPAGAVEDQTISLLEPAPASVEVGQNWLLQARSTSGLQVNYRVVTPSTCQESGPAIVPNFEVWGTSPGACTVRVTQPGNAQYAPAQKDFTVNVTKAPTYTIINTFTPSDHTQNTRWFAPGEPIDVQIDVVRQNDDPGSYAVIDGEVQYRVDGDPEVTTALKRVDGTNRVAFAIPAGLPLGTHVITADFKGNATDELSQAYMHDMIMARVSTLTIDVSPANPEVGDKTTIWVHVGLRDAQKLPAPTGTISVKADDFDLGGATLDANGDAAVVTRRMPAGPGVTVEVDYSGDSETTPGDETVTVDVTKGVAKALVMGPKGYLVGDDMSVVLAAQVPDGWRTARGDFTLWVQPVDGPKTKVGDYALGLDGTKDVTITDHLPAGVYVFWGDYHGDDNYEPASAPMHPFEVVKYGQEITFTQPDPMRSGSTQALAAVSDAGLPVTVTSLTPTVCSVTQLLGGSQVNALIAGTCTLRATQDGDDSTEAAEPVQRQVAVAKTAQKLTFGQPDPMLVGGTQRLHVSSDREPVVVVTSLTPTVCTVQTLPGGEEVTAVGQGTCTLQGSQDGTDAVEPATIVQRTFPVTKHAQTVHVTLPDLLVGQTATIHANASSGLPVTVTAQSDGVCTVSGSTVTARSAGGCVIVADQAGDAKYGPAASVTATAKVSLRTQTITLTTAKRISVRQRKAVAASASSGLRVSIVSGTPKTCVVKKNTTLIGRKRGTCRLTATQKGNSLWSPAPQVGRRVTVK